MSLDRRACGASACALAVALSWATVHASVPERSACANPSFRIPDGSPLALWPQRDVQGHPRGLASGRFFEPGDCRCDLVGVVQTRATAANPEKGFAMLFRSNDDGTVSQRALIETDENPVAVASGRFDNTRSDDFDDIVVLSGSGLERGRIALYRRDAVTGVYSRKRPPASAPPDAWSAGQGPTALATGDFDGDGHLDVAVAGAGDRTVTVLFGTGDGGFALEARAVALRGKPSSLAVGAFSGPSRPDALAVGLVAADAGGAGQVEIAIVSQGPAGAFMVNASVEVGAGGDPWLATANLTASPRGSSPGRGRDLAVAYTARDGTGVHGRVKTLLGRDEGGFQPSVQETDRNTGAFPQAVAAADIDDDGVVDLMVSTYSELASRSDGTIRFFQGRSASDGGPGFHARSDWPRIPESTGIRPRSLVVGRFGPRGAEGGQPHMGLAAINASNLDTLSLFVGNGRGAFVQPAVVTTPLRTDARLLVHGDFHSETGDDVLEDVAYVRTDPDGSSVLTVLLSNGAGGLAEPADASAQPPIGGRPVLMAAGRFDDRKPLDLAIVDVDSGDALERPLVKILSGTANGVFKRGPGVSEVFLDAGQVPVAMVAGHFRGPSSPLDLAIASAAAGGAGLLTVLFNDGRGAFTAQEPTTLDFTPSAVVASDNLREARIVDLLIRDATRSRFMFFVNMGDGHFRPASPRGVVDGAGPLGALLIGPVPTADASRSLDGVITFSENMALTTFKSDGNEKLTRVPVINPLGDLGYRFAHPEYARVGPEGVLGLAAAAVAPTGQHGLVTVMLPRPDGASGGTPPTPRPASTFTPFGNAAIPTGGGRITAHRTFFAPSATLHVEQAARARVMDMLVGVFRSRLHGNGQADLALVVETTGTAIDAGQCAEDPREPPPPPPPPPTPPLFSLPCPNVLPDSPPGKVFLDGPCCRCRRFCPNTCDVPPEDRPTPPPPPPPPPPLLPFCETTTTYRMLTVYGNTCEG